MAEKKPRKLRAAGTTRKRRKPAGVSTGLAAAELLAAAPPGEVAELHRAIEDDGGKVLAVYREPFGGRWLLMAALPIEKVAPTPYQRNLSETHVRKLEAVIGKLGRFLDPIIAVRAPQEAPARYWTPNGHHRLSAMKTLGAKSITAIVVPEGAVAYQILALKARGLTSPYLKSFVVARINPIRFRPKEAAPLSFDESFERMTKAAAKLNPDTIAIDDLARSGGALDEGD